MYLHSPAQSGSTTLCFLFCASVEEDGLELSVPWPPGRAHAKAGPAIADAQGQSGPQVRDRTVIASRARRDLQAGRLGRRVRWDYLHEVPHDMETQATRQIDA